MERKHFIERQRALAATAVVLAASIAIPPLLDFTVDFSSFQALFGMAAVFGLPLPYLAWRRMDRLYDALETSSLTVLVCFTSLVLSYAAMRLGMPLADEMLADMDRTIGLSSISIIETANRFPLINMILALSYTSLLCQIFFLPVVLAMFISSERAYQFLLAYILLSATSIIVSIPFPSLGAVIGQGYDPSSFMYVNEEASRGFIASLNAVRGAGHFSLSLDIARGILTFPSGHAGMAVVCAWATWPSRLLRWPSVTLNALMFIAAVTCGSHYVVDILAGGLLAVIAASIASAQSLDCRKAFRGLSVERPQTPQGAPAGVA